MHKNHTLGSFFAFFPAKTRAARIMAVLLFLIAMPLYAAELNVTGEIQTSSITVTGLDCTANANGGTLTANASGTKTSSWADGALATNTKEKPRTKAAARMRNLAELSRQDAAPTPQRVPKSTFQIRLMLITSASRSPSS